MDSLGHAPNAFKPEHPQKPASARDKPLPSVKGICFSSLTSCCVINFQEGSEVSCAARGFQSRLCEKGSQDEATNHGGAYME